MFFLGLVLIGIVLNKIRIQRGLVLDLIVIYKYPPEDFISISFVTLILGLLSLVFVSEFIGLSAISVGLAFLSIGLGLRSVQLGRKSDEKMTALAELNFVEKNAMMNRYIGAYKNKTVNYTKKIIRDLEASFKVVDWIKVEDGKTKKNFIDTFIELTETIRDNKILQNLEKADKKDYVELIETAKKFKYRTSDLEKLKKNIF